ncbi:MAG: hypothetical protein M0R77_16745 [Gammaproteobacteria bacterium]|nr:hypothetical protein [Gammaproteobacteria bacterium]
MIAENLAYALVQVLHNLGAALVLGAALAALWPGHLGDTRGLARLQTGAWALQALTGAGLGAVSFYFYGRFPEITVLARIALGMEIAAAFFGVGLGVFYLRTFATWAEAGRRRAWRIQAALAAIALTAAAFLRWFS